MVRASIDRGLVRGTGTRGAAARRVREETLETATL